MNKLIVYIAGPITGYENGNKEAFDKAERDIKEENNNTIVLNPTCLPAGLTQFAYMDICLAMIRSCHVVYFLRGWESSEGAVAENALAKKLKRHLIYEEDL